jgi:predicted transcriptional regulator
MEHLAYWIHQQGGTGDRDGGTLIDHKELVDQVSSFIKGRKGVELYLARMEGERFVNFIRDRTGLLNEQGQDCYAFVHKTFQEYLCAQEILYRADNEDDFGIVLKHIKEHLHTPHWKQVLLLLVAQLKPQKAVKAIKAIIENGSLYERWLHRDLLFAGSCLAEDPQDLSTTDADLPQNIIRRLFDLEIANPFFESYKVKGKLFEVIVSLHETTFAELALNELKGREDSIEKSRLRRYRAALEKQALISDLIAQLHDQDRDARWEAASALGQLGDKSERVISEILKLLHDQEDYIRANAVFMLGRLGDKSERVISELLNLLHDEWSDVRRAAARALGELGDKSEQVISELLNSLHDKIRVPPAKRVVC